VRERYVSTRAIQAAVQGRETEMLEALQISWENGGPHIHCPYPDHNDENPSWRWDRAKARAHPTCIARGEHSIFDVVMQIESSNFEAAKLRIAQILGRTDLIKGGDRDRTQAMNAASLLRPPADERDETLSCDFDPVDELTIFASGDWNRPAFTTHSARPPHHWPSVWRLGSLDDPL
jgi:hypothetical protein